MTKYPSIKTYHVIGEKGRLKNEILVNFNNKEGILTEKIDGVNGRIIFCPNERYIIGSREELLYAQGDLIGNNQLGIVSTLKEIAEKIHENTGMQRLNIIEVMYFEVLGGNTTKNSKQYTGSKQTGYRLFDIAEIKNTDELMAMSREQIANWRDNGGQQFCDEETLTKVSKMLSIELTPRIGVSKIPTDIKETYDWMKTTIKTTNVKLDNDGLGRPEGIVARTPDRSIIAKLRFEDYERTLKNIK